MQFISNRRLTDLTHMQGYKTFIESVLIEQNETDGLFRETQINVMQIYINEGTLI